MFISLHDGTSVRPRLRRFSMAAMAFLFKSGIGIDIAVRIHFLPTSNWSYGSSDVSCLNSFYDEINVVKEKPW